MSSLARSAGRRPQKPVKGAAPKAPAMLSEAERKALRRRFLAIAAITLACCAAAYAGMLGAVRLHQWWGTPLFVLARVAGFGTQIVFIVGLVKANRTDTSSNRGA